MLQTLHRAPQCVKKPVPTAAAPTRSSRRVSFLLGFLLVSFPALLLAAEEEKVPIQIEKAAGAITIDGELNDAAWQNAKKIETWYETNIGDSNPNPPARSVGMVVYDERFLYAAFRFYDPNPAAIRAPYTDRDNVSSSTDYGGLIIDSIGSGKTGVLFLATPRGVQYDSVNDDTSGSEDSSPDFFWDSAAKITSDGWQLEIRIPFSSLRYTNREPQKWGLMMYRNYPRDRRYQMFTSKLPKGANCFICQSAPLLGLRDLPAGGHLIAAPYVTVKAEGQPRDGIGTPLVTRAPRGDGGLDVKWMPNANTAIDGTLNPDFSQIESDVAAISANERFAIFFPEKRPFFLEGVELFSTPIQAVYTRTITSPRWGARSTGKFGQNAYTVLVTEDRGNGVVILPGSNGSDFADQDFESLSAIGRLRHDFGSSFASVLFTDREIKNGGHNRVLGPDFQWRPTTHDNLTGQILFSDSVTPNRPDLAREWDGRKLSSHGGDLWYQHSTKTFDFFTEYKDFGDDFRADSGFVPQVGYRENFIESGYTVRPTGFVNRIRTFVLGDYSTDTDGRLLFRQLSAGFGADGKWTSFLRLRFANDLVRSGSRTFERNQLLYNFSIVPSATITSVALSGWLGQNVDFANSRLGRGANVDLSATIHPGDHLELKVNSGVRWLNVDPHSQRLFVAQVHRLKATYNFSSRSFVRAITQYVRTDRATELYQSEVNRRGGSLSNSLLFAYKLNWQSVLFLGVGDGHVLTEDDRIEPSERQIFMKVSYAFQR